MPYVLGLCYSSSLPSQAGSLPTGINAMLSIVFLNYRSDAVKPRLARPGVKAACVTDPVDRRRNDVEHERVGGRRPEA